MLTRVRSQSHHSLIPCGEGSNVLSTQVLNISTDSSSLGISLHRALDLTRQNPFLAVQSHPSHFFGSDTDGHMQWLKQKATLLPSLSFPDPLPVETSRSGRRWGEDTEGWRQAEQVDICSGSSYFKKPNPHTLRGLFCFGNTPVPVEPGSLKQKAPATVFQTAGS